jgi:hypothetical protein
MEIKMTKVSDIFSEKSVKEEVFVETEILEEVSTAKATKKTDLFSPKEVKESADIFPTPEPV